MNQIKCPNCHQVFEITEALKSEIKLESQKELEEKLRAKIKEENETEVLDLKRALEEKDKKVMEMRDGELKLREEKRKLEEAKKDVELEVARRVDQERKQIQEDLVKQVTEEHRLKILEKDEQIAGMKKSLEEAQRKGNQVSQQTQGEVLELDLEATLKNSFPQDQIEAIGKGKEGADIRQIVKSPKGYFCGIILWEVKRTKAWSNEWLIKLKDDLRAEKADAAVIITTTLPKEMKSSIDFLGGVLVCKNDSPFISVAIVLRQKFLAVGYQKVISASKTKKADLLYEFVTGNKFHQQVEALVEVYQEMQAQVMRERIAFEKSWRAREGQIKRFFTATANIYGGIQGPVGSSLPQIRGLELLESG